MLRHSIDQMACLFLQFRSLCRSEASNLSEALTPNSAEEVEKKEIQFAVVCVWTRYVLGGAVKS